MREPKVMFARFSIKPILSGGVAAFTLLWITQVSPCLGQEARFFRIASPVPTRITQVTANGTVTWTNQVTNATFTIQTATAMPAETNWVDWVQVPVTDTLTAHRTFDANPPAGMALIPAGSFTMGDTFNEGPSNEHPTHTVYVSAFYMDKLEVSKALWDEVKAWNGGNGYTYDNPGQGKAAGHPVHTVNWYDCVKWCNARSEKDGLTPCYYADAGLTMIYKTGQAEPHVNWSTSGYRLPTEAEWEKAARGGLSGKRFPWGDTITHSLANYYSSSSDAYDISQTRTYHPTYNDGTYPYTSPVGSFPSNNYELRDMAGNVWEWCWDWSDVNWYTNAGATQNDTRGPANGTSHLLRGGNWGHRAYEARCASRFNGSRLSAGFNWGFRCVRGL